MQDVGPWGPWPIVVNEDHVFCNQTVLLQGHSQSNIMFGPLAVLRCSLQHNLDSAKIGNLIRNAEICLMILLVSIVSFLIGKDENIQLNTTVIVLTFSRLENMKQIVSGICNNLLHDVLEQQSQAFLYDVGDDFIDRRPGL